MNSLHADWEPLNADNRVFAGSKDLRSYTSPMHSHPFTEIIMVLRGQGRQLLEERSVPLQPGDVFVSPPGSLHAYECRERLSFLNVIFDPAELLPHEADLRLLPGYQALFLLEPRYRSRHGEGGRLHLPPEKMNILKGSVQEMEAELEADAPGRRTLIRAALVRLTVLLARCYGEAGSIHARNLLGLGRVISLMERDYARPLTLAEMAEAASMSPRNLNRRFRETMGVSPMEHLIGLRLRKAEVLLREGELNISEVAASVGMPDSNYFSRRFKQRTGLSPRAFRRMLHQEK